MMALRLVHRYIVFAGLLANLVLVAFFLFWAINKMTASQPYRDIQRVISGSPDGIEVTPLQPVASGQVNPELLALPAGKWIKIHEQSRSDPSAFVRQAHGGAAFDPIRGRIMLFGSDTHGQNWDNTVRFFDMSALNWSSAYPPDPPETYRVNADGIPVAGTQGNHPWAMHSLDAVEFDPTTDQLIVASHPEHLDPNRFGGVSPSLWNAIRKHPTWAYHVGQNRWKPLVDNATSLFPYGGTFDPENRRLIGVKPDGYWLLDIDNPKWQRAGKGTPQVWNNTAVFDNSRQTVVTFGSHRRSNTVWQYQLGENKGRAMPTPGNRPPGASSAPMVFHPEIKEVVALVETNRADNGGETQTWLYSTTNDSWTHLTNTSIPFKIGMNYDLVYDTNHHLIVLVANYPHEPPSVWVLKLNARNLN